MKTGVRCGDQPLVVEEGAAERRLEKIVGDNVIWRARLMQIFVNG